jgi:hypothetical protein
VPENLYIVLSSFNTLLIFISACLSCLIHITFAGYGILLVLIRMWLIMVHNLCSMTFLFLGKFLKASLIDCVCACVVMEILVNFSHALGFLYDSEFCFRFCRHFCMFAFLESQCPRWWPCKVWTYMCVIEATFICVGSVQIVYFLII